MVLFAVLLLLLFLPGMQLKQILFVTLFDVSRL